MSGHLTQQQKSTAVQFWSWLFVLATFVLIVGVLGMIWSDERFTYYGFWRHMVQSSGFVAGIAFIMTLATNKLTKPTP